MKKALFTMVVALVMAVTAAPARSAQWNYVFVTFTGYASGVSGAQTFRLFLQYDVSSGTQIDIKGTLLAFDTWGNPPAKLTGSGDIESDGTIDSFNVTGATSDYYQSYTYDFDFNINSKDAKVTMTFTQPKAFGGTTTTDYVFYGTWNLVGLPNK
jgi:hypothetical protein